MDPNIRGRYNGKLKCNQSRLNLLKKNNTMKQHLAKINCNLARM